MFLGQNKTLVRRFIDEVWNMGDVSALNQVVSIGYIEHSPLPKQVPGFEGIKQAFTMLRDAFPDLHFKIEDMFAEENKIVVRGIFRGTHQGAILDVPPSGEPVSIPEIHIYRIVAGKIMEHWGEFICPAALKQQSAQPSFSKLMVPLPQLSSVS